ncbi:uncharacterized protein BJ212DRAFT_1482990 [Suillus subaureus]|uniref:BTB domain-containing protein n=1 Tax=Suillus subaureus TaxID=48587 RepID=A0A9P7E6T5_9AGAM|nr:uncharacterized protein BJ212DRAFT_1482990 [Suillus subaureus]KAG1812931.1 hypothetical protein BJ212DRAFT_1482990 [Suillus subaureus]
MSDAEEPTTTAEAPFDNPDGDIILRSTVDHVDFHTFKVILSLMSPVFKDMFTLPQNSSQSGVSSVLVIPVAESGTTLESLLLLCYPAGTPTFDSLGDAKAVMEVAKKYDMQAAFNRAADLVIAQFPSDRALELYALFCQFGLQDHAQIAATQALKIKDLGRPSHVFNGLRNITGFDYHRLLAYHQECGVAAREAVKSRSYNAREWMCGKKTCTMAKTPPAARAPAWFDEYLDLSGKELLTRPCESTLLESASYICATIKAMECAKSISCKDCKSDLKVIQSMDKFRALCILHVQIAIMTEYLEDSD